MTKMQTRVIRVFDRGFRLALLCSVGRVWWHYIPLTSGTVKMKSRRFEFDEDTGEKEIPWDETDYRPEAMKKVLRRRSGATKEATPYLKRGV